MRHKLALSMRHRNSIMVAVAAAGLLGIDDTAASDNHKHTVRLHLWLPDTHCTVHCQTDQLVVQPAWLRQLAGPTCLQVVVSLPFSVLNMLAYSGVWYGMASMRSGVDVFGKFFCILALVYLIGNQVRVLLQRHTHVYSHVAPTAVQLK